MSPLTTTATRPGDARPRNPEAMSLNTLARENERYAGTRGVSRANRSLGFRPGFRDARSGDVYPSRFANGRPAPIHMLDGLPSHLISRFSASGRAIEAAETLESGFIAGDRFLTREQAAKAVMH